MTIYGPFFYIIYSFMGSIFKSYQKHFMMNSFIKRFGGIKHTLFRLTHKSPQIDIQEKEYTIWGGNAQKCICIPCQNVYILRRKYFLIEDKMSFLQNRIFLLHRNEKQSNWTCLPVYMYSEYQFSFDQWVLTNAQRSIFDRQMHKEVFLTDTAKNQKNAFDYLHKHV